MGTTRLTISTAKPAGPPGRVALLLAFFVIYVVWGSTYLAIRYAVESIPPLVVVVRQGIAGLAIFGYAYWCGYRPTAREWRASVGLGILYFGFGHGTLHWAETFVPSGLTALLIASEPIWIAAMAALVSREERLTGKTILGLLLGIAGVALLMDSQSGAGHMRLVIGCVAVLLSAASWACGVIYSRNPALPADPVARAGMVALTGAAMLLLVGLAAGDVRHAHVAMFTARSIWALLYLIVFGSIVAFTTYTWMLDHCSPTLVSTHTYVNPIIAVLLGWAFAGESFNGRMIFAGLLTLLAVFLITRGTRGHVARVMERAEEAA